MPDIQEQVEDFKKYHMLKSDEMAFLDILRQVVEECCDCTVMANEEDAIREHFRWLEGE